MSWPVPYRQTCLQGVTNAEEFFDDHILRYVVLRLRMPINGPQAGHSRLDQSDGRKYLC